jgi:4a-hydroxytetrahydrobiopterin dehydratase
MTDSAKASISESATPAQPQARSGSELRERLTPDNAAAMLQGWSVQTAPRDVLAKTFNFAGFAEAIQWMVKVAAEAERLDHHPEWFNVYDRVEVRLTTHDAGGVTPLDVDLARFMDAAFSR